MEATLSPNLARAKFFALVDLVSKAVSYVDNPACSSSGGAGIKAGQFLIDNNVDVLITRQLGQNASDMLSPTVAILTGIDASIAVNLDQYLQGALRPGLTAHSGYHHG